MRYESDQAFIDSKLEKYEASAAVCLGGKRYQLICAACKQAREVWYTTGPNGKLTCDCRRLRGHQSFEFHQKELGTEYPDFELLKFRKHPQKCQYKHTCGNTFEAQRLAFKRTLYPCDQCRPSRCKTPETFKAEFDSRKFENAELRSSYVSQKVKLTLGFKSCRHTITKDSSSILTYPKSAIEKCPVCFPKWQHVDIGGKRFVLRSGVERRFVEFLVNEKGIPASEIHYEPREFTVDYREAATGLLRRYYPDFKVRNVLVEIKDKSSLGITSWYLNKDGKEVFKENRAKFLAARKQIKDFRVYVETKEGFKMIRELNRNKLKKELS